MQSSHDYLAANSLATQLQQQLGLAPGPSSASSSTLPGTSMAAPAHAVHSGSDLLSASRQGSGAMASTSLAAARRGSDSNLQQQQQPQQQLWGEPQAGTQGLQRGHPSQDDVFSAVGGLELGSNASARDLAAETSGSFVDHQQQQAPHRQGSSEYPFHQPGIVHAASSGSLSGIMPTGPLISHSASTASLQNMAMGEPPPCRTIFVRNIDPNTDDLQLQAMFEKCGDIRTLYNASKLQGYVLITYYDGRAGNYAKAALDGVLLNGRHLRIEPSGPGQKIHDKDTQSATVSVFGVNEAMSDADFRDYMQELAGDVASVSRSTAIPGCRLAEYWDVRSAHLALNKLNGNQARVPTIVEGPSQLPANLRNVQSSHVLQSTFPAANQAGPPPADDTGSFRPSSWDNSVSPLFTEESLGRGNSADMLAGVLRQPGGAELIRQELLRSSSSSNALQALQAAHALGHSGSSGSLSGISLQQSASQTGINNMGQSASHSNLAHAAGGSPSRQNSMEPGSPRLLNSARRDFSAPHLPQQAWQSNVAGGLPQRGASFSTGDLAGLYDGSLVAAAAPGTQQGLRGVGSTGSLWNHNQMGSPTGQSSAAWTGHTGGLPQQGSASSLSAAAEGAAWGAYQGAEAALRAQMALGMLPPTGNGGLDGSSLNAVAQRLAAGGGYAPRSGGLSGDAQAILQQHAALGLNPRQSAALLAQMQGGATGRMGGSQGGLRSMGGPLTGSYSRSRGSRDDLPSSGARSGRRTADPLAEAERKAQQEKMYALDYDKVMAGDDKRTTIMLKNIPNKYTQKMLLATIDEEFRGTYDFFYLPIDFKNKCNVGYAFINLLRPETIVPLAQRFNRKKWERFNSEKVCNITYARIQGKGALVTHFQNSSLLHEDKRCRPILFRSDGSQASDQEAFPTSASRSSLRGNPPRPPSPPALPPLGPTQEQQQQQQQQQQAGPSLNSSLLTSTEGMHGSSLAPGGPLAS